MPDTPNTVFASLSPYVYRSPKFDDLKFQVLNDAARLFAADGEWRWMVTPVTSVTLTAGVAVTTLIASAPTDYLKISQAWLAVGDQIYNLFNTTGSPGDLLTKGLPQQIFDYLESGAIKARVFPVPPTGSAYTLHWAYRKKVTEITDANDDDSTTFQFPQDYVHIYRMYCLHFAGVYTKNPSAGTATVATNSRGATVEYTGWLGRAKAAAESIRTREELLISPRGDRE